MLLNSQQELPTRFFVFVNMGSPVARQNYDMGVYHSGTVSSWSNSLLLGKYIEGTIDYLPYKLCDRDSIDFSAYCVTAINDYRIEHDAEVIRSKYFQLLPSRLSAIFAFGDFETCIAVSKKYGWGINTVREFEIMPCPLNRIIKVNMVLVSLARYAYKYMGEDDILYLWKKYWLGDGELAIDLPDSPYFEFNRRKAEVIWEYLVEGCLVPVTS